MPAHAYMDVGLRRDDDKAYFQRCPQFKLRASVVKIMIQVAYLEPACFLSALSAHHAVYQFDPVHQTTTYAFGCAALRFKRLDLFLPGELFFQGECHGGSSARFFYLALDFF